MEEKKKQLQHGSANTSTGPDAVSTDTGSGVAHGISLGTEEPFAVFCARQVMN